MVPQSHGVEESLLRDVKKRNEAMQPGETPQFEQKDPTPTDIKGNPLLSGDYYQPPQSQKRIQQVTLVSPLDARSAQQKKANAGRNAMIAGAVMGLIGVAATALSQGEVLYWGAILFGGGAFIWGLVEYTKNRKGDE
jgi:hypothetical protein